MRRWRADNVEHIKKYNREYKQRYRLENPEKLKKLRLASYHRNIEKYAEYRKKNSGRINSHNAKRRNLQLDRIPKSANLDAIISIYEEAKNLSRTSGVPHHVDHIVPLQGKYVNGLHAEWNLQIITAHENLTKSNKFNVEVDFVR